MYRRRQTEYIQVCTRLSRRTVRFCCLCFNLRSASTGLLQALRARTTIGRRSFAVAGPSLWNSLPVALWRPEMTFHTFKRQLSLPHLIWWRKEGTFTTARRCYDVFVILAPDTKLQTYLHLLTGRAVLVLGQWLVVNYEDKKLSYR